MKPFSNYNFIRLKSKYKDHSTCTNIQTDQMGPTKLKSNYSDTNQNNSFFFSEKRSPLIKTFLGTQNEDLSG